MRRKELLSFFLLVLLPKTCVAFQEPLKPVQTNTGATMRSVVESELAKSTVLFEGEVQRFELRHAPGTPTPKGRWGMMAWDGDFVVIINASRVYRGPVQNTFEIHTSMYLTELEVSDFIFDVGKTYLVDAVEDSSGDFRVVYGSATRLLEQAGPELRVLRGEPPIADDLLSPSEYYKKWPVPLPHWAGKICGHVFRKDGKPVSRDVRITAWRLRNPLLPENFGEADINAEIEVDGTFCLDSLTSGNYIVGAEERSEQASHSQTEEMHYAGYHPGVLLVSEAVPISLKDGQTISNAKIVLYPDHLYRLQGKVVTSDGSPLPSEYITVGIESADGRLLQSSEETKVDKDGKFEFKSLAPGNYSVFAFFEWDKPETSWNNAETNVTVRNDNNRVELGLTPRH